MIRPVVATALLATLLVATHAETDVVVGTKDNFDDIIASEQLTLVKFFAPWCGHCKKMIPDFEGAATELKGKATLVDLDATVEKDIATKYQVRGFPTLKLFSKGEVVSDYKGGRTKDAIIKYIERALLPSYEELADAAAVTKFVSESKGKAITFGAKLDKFQSEFNKASLSLRDLMPDGIVFASVADAALLKDIAGGDVPDDSILLVRDDETTVKYTGEPDGLEAWLKINSLPLYSELSRENASMYTELGTPIFMLFQDPEKKDEEVNKIVVEVAKEMRSEGLPFTWISLVELKSFAEHLGVAENKPAIAIYEFKSDAKYVFSEEFSKETLIKWATMVNKGDAAPTMKSEEVPETNDEPVKIVVGNSWETVVEDQDKDVLIEQYAPWCGHCKKLNPILDDLAKKLEGVKTLVIAKMDATKNDAPSAYKAKGFPTLHFFKAGEKAGVTYQGERGLKDFVKYLKANAKFSDGIELPEEVADEAETKTEAKEEDKEEL